MRFRWRNHKRNRKDRHFQLAQPYYLGFRICAIPLFNAGWSAVWKHHSNNVCSCYPLLYCRIYCKTHFQKIKIIFIRVVWQRRLHLPNCPRCFSPKYYSTNQFLGIKQADMFRAYAFWCKFMISNRWLTSDRQASTRMRQQTIDGQRRMFNERPSSENVVKTLA